MDARGFRSIRRVANPEDYFLSLGGERGQTVQIPVDWKIDALLMRLMVKERLAELED